MSDDNRNAAALGAQYSGMQGVQTARLDDDIPDEIVPLPSGGKVYPPDSPLHDKETIDIKVMTAREEDILTNRALIKKGTVLTELLKSCICDKRINVQDMLTGDRNAVMVALRITGYGSDYGPLEVKCESCDFVNKEHSFELSGLPLRPLDIVPVHPFVNKFEFTLPQSGMKVYFKLLTGKDEEELSKILENSKKLGELAVKSVSTRLIHQIIQIGESDKKSDVAKFVSKMRAGDSKALRKYIDEHTPSIDMTQEYTCPNCGDERKVDVPLTQQFFWPE